MTEPSKLQKMYGMKKPCEVCGGAAHYTDPEGRRLCVEHGGLPPIRSYVE